MNTKCYTWSYLKTNHFYLTDLKYVYELNDINGVSVWDSLHTSKQGF